MRLVEVGKIVNTHGVRGDVKITPFTNTPEFFLRFGVVYVRDIAYNVLSSRVHAKNIIARLEGIDSYEAANALRNTAVFADKDDAELDEGEHFVDDVIGLRAVDDETSEELGVITGFFTLPSNGVYVVSGDRMIPAVPEFVRRIDVPGGEVRFRLIEGM